MKPIQTIGVILRPNTPSLNSYYEEIRKTFLKYRLTCLLDKSSADMIGNPNGVPFAEILKRADLLLAVGGDGTLLALIRRAYGSLIPVAGINMGRLGFLAEFRRNELDLLCDSLLNGRYYVQEALMLEGHLEWQGDTAVMAETVGVNFSRAACVFNSPSEAIFFAFNEFTLMRNDAFGMIYPKVSIVVDGEKKPFNSFGGDGLIISTPHGSTAYNISAGGPVVYPFSENIILTPVCAHSLTQSPLVLSSNFELCIELLEPSEASLLIDGQRKLKFNFGDCLRVRRAEHSSMMLHTKEYDYFKLLREKFRWG